MKRFELHRDVDETGVSGTGVVAEGIEFSDGTAALRWRTVPFTSTAVYNNMAELETIHGHGGLTRVVWLEPAAVPFAHLPAHRGVLVALVGEALERITPGAACHAESIVDYAFMPARSATDEPSTYRA